MAHSFAKLGLMARVLLLSPVLAELSSNIIKFTPGMIADITAFTTFENDTTTAQFQVYDDSFHSILGETPTLSVILNSTNSSFPQFHEAAILSSTNPPTLFVTSNQYTFPGINSPTTSNKTISISRISQNTTDQPWTSEIITPTGYPIHLANGGFPGPNGTLIFCAQGDLTSPGGLLQLTSEPPFTSTNIINSYLSIPFNSPNDVVRTSDGALWFTDPQFGSWQSIRPSPLLPSQVYRFMPGTTDIRVVTDSLTQPNGITFSPDEKIAYITDTATNSTHPTAPKTIYAFDVISVGGSPALSNKRTFAMPEVGIPDGIKTDAKGNVYAGCGDGVNVWNPAGVLLGKIMVEGGSANFAIVDGKVFILAETKLYLAELGGLVVSK